MPNQSNGSERAMTSYRVDFMNEFARNSRVHKVCQRSIVVGSARSPEQAGEAAKTDFARLEGICDWRIHAATIEVVPIKDDGVSDINAPALDPSSGGNQRFRGHKNAEKLCSGTGRVAGIGFDRVNALSVQKPDGNQLSNCVNPNDVFCSRKFATHKRS
jgi:hypothetical protein